jgi:ABC-type lipoprotein release transport system permease subunit
MIQNSTCLALSQIQVHAPGYYPGRSILKTIGGTKGTNVGALLGAIAADRRVYAASPRVYGEGLVSAGDRSAGVELLGVVPGQEQRVTLLQTQIVKGSYLTAREPKSLAIGDKLASTIGVQMGSEIVLLTQAADGSIGNDLYTVGGIFHTGIDAMDLGLVLMPLSSLQELLQLVPGRIHEIGIKLNDVTEATAVASALQTRLATIAPVRAMAWPELAPELAAYVQFNRGITFVQFIIYFLMAVIGIMLMALGMRPFQVIGLILAEAAGLAGASLVLGAALGAPVLWYLQVHGLDLGGSKGEVISLAGVVVGHLWYGRQDFPSYSQAALGLAVTAILSAFYPAWRAAHFRPTEAMRKV